jgi:ESF2/ABP1 family protein
MVAEKRNQYLDVEESDDGQSEGYSSEADELRKGSGHSSKRRKIEESPDPLVEDHLDEIEELGVDSAQLSRKESKEKKRKIRERERDYENGDPGERFSRISKPLTKKNLITTDAAIRKSGVIYLSRIPPFMKPQKLRSLLEPYGSINRTFLNPEDEASYARRVRNGGNKKRSYTEGWVEFTNKKDAKRACELLNARTIGGKKGSYYYDDIWNLIYLKGFKWHNLTEQIAAENAERASRLRAEISKSTKENKEFVRNVEKAKMLDGMHAKATAKKRKLRAHPEEAMEDKGFTAQGNTKTYTQKPTAKRASEGNEPPEHVTKVLSKIF